uniref:Uncharacterized protein n=1 Tax=viral metagenome TaxID=1070528 RepID=A0A6C0B4Z4_9ZZZZ
MNALDELTLKLLTSKKKYNNYLANAMPDKSVEVRIFYDKIAKFRPRIQTLLGRYLDDPAAQTTNDVDDAVEQCLRTVVKHLEMRDYENKCADDETDSSEEEEVLFQTQIESDQRSLEETDQRSSEESAKETSINTTSFWGGRVNKQSSIDSFVRRRKK